MIYSRNKEREFMERRQMEPTSRVRTIFAGDNKIIWKKYMLSNNLNLDTTNCFIGSNIIRIYLHLRLTIPNLLPSGPSKSDPLAGSRLRLS